MTRESHQGAWVKRHRELLGLTQAELAATVREDGVRLSRSHLANIEAGIYAAPAELIRAIAKLRRLDVRDTWQHVATLPRTRNEDGRTLRQVSQIADASPPPLAGIANTPAPPIPHASATEILDWARNVLASFASGDPAQIVLTTAGPLAKALRAAPPPGGLLGGLLGRGIRAVLEEGAELHHVLAVPADPEAHFEIVAEALPLAARYCLPSSQARPHLSRYNLTLVPDFPAGPDLIASSQAKVASMILPIMSQGQPGITVVQAMPHDGEPGAEPSQAWAREYATWLASHGTELFSWVTVVPAGTLSMPAGPWEELLTEAWEHPGGRDSIQRMLPLNTMSDDLRSQLVAAQARRRGHSQGSVGTEVRRRMSMYKARRDAMIRNLENGYSYRNVVTREALDDLVEHGQYTMERLPDNVLTASQAASYLQATIDLIRSFDTFEVLILTDDQLELALPLGVSWIVKRSPRRHTPSTERAWAFLPYIFNDELMAMNVIVNDKLAIDAIGHRVDALWTTWSDGRTPKDIRQETLAELERAQHRIAAHIGSRLRAT